ncbi:MULTISPECIES: hypothetical protein [unclassified Streptomyces]|uniref:hypothetical protein n=1 Tax=unclassified Streptomyces TaxID=2593676 RepID=UPI000DBA921B|nr:hypothetical protein [Streptomyces sp. PsTaAH-130]MYU03817.1 hypothetical protein [Streptomyces sp. SID8366]MYU66908.1 hypothetical protein [Streptomyces sp. SID69]RAJ50925.1 hypothetical protein K376_06488 [Streptomyces sp. PsTaAH-130]
MAETRRRLRSGAVVLGGVGLLAAALTACSSQPDKRCVDQSSYTYAKGYKVVSDKNCKAVKSAVNGAWYYGGKKKGSWVSGGSFTKPRHSSGHSTHHSSTHYGSGSGGVHRGGFGGGSHSSGG